MNDEIKEILEYLNKNKEGLKDKNYYPEDLLSCKDLLLLLDYITNLQQERDKFKLRCFKAYKMIFDNYGVLDKYEIEMLEDILKGKEDEQR